MSQTVRIMGLALGVLLVLASPSFAQDGAKAAVAFSGAIGAGVTLLGAGYGIARIGAAAVESMARQPDVAANVQTAMIISCALIEGATFFALIVCIIAGG